MLPVIALVGRPNVGKSTLFNVLTKSRDALVADFPGLTRDRQYGLAKRGRRPFLVVDTGGIIEQAEGIEDQAMRQVWSALDEADVILFLVDARAGLNPADEAIAQKLRRTSKPVLLVANKTEGLNPELAAAEFHRMGLSGQPHPIAAAHGTGVAELVEYVESLLPARDETGVDEADEQTGVRIAVIGRPNVGKSTLVNRLLGEERVVVYDQPGTTRDSIYIPFEREGTRYTLIDTAGIRRRARVGEGIEKFSVIKSLQAIERAHVVIYLIDAREGVTDQDANLLGMVLDTGRSLIVGLNKWDGMSQDQRDQIKRQIDLKLTFVDFAEKRYLSALHGTGVGKLLEEVDRIHEQSMRKLSASKLTDILMRAQAKHQPPLVRGRRIRLKFAHQGGHNPPTIIIHGNQTDEVPGSYTRYLINVFRDFLKLDGTPIKLEYRVGDNPFKDRKNVLTERQIQKRRRLMKHVKKK
ncbi:ribosome biogenesis GTPase Der [Methylococcus sp. EFPC2]|uniref:ribosome biogenesis GTPase Der n=1 Tax=Methylococcus sp. EFPC2 TaxID=2812648 RepID=UPI0019687CAF|nr:ribosome biogenesis GTPase Der [Methylococcus sp. EFPC2]QSA99183.1 ribosome biogenesis GTPase Der [Methylococcus sp. EFPC2]